MALSEARASALIWLAFLSLSVVGCQSTPRQLDPAEYTDDFGGSIGTEVIDEESVGANQMLHRRARLEPYVRAVVPLESNFDVGSALGVRGSMEVQKNLFLGMAIDWVHLESDDDISDAINDGNLLGVDADEYYESLDRFNFLATFDYDFHLADEFLADNSPLTLGLGLGAGITVVTGDEADGDFISDFDLEPYVGLLLRPSADLRWKLAEMGFLTLNLSFDWIPQDKIDIDFLGDRREVDDSIDFSSFNVGLGYTFEF